MNKVANRVPRLYSAQVVGIRPQVITIEVDLFKGFHSFNVVGLPDKAVEEARDRMGSAIKSIGFVSPKSKSQKVVVSLAPADLKKEGPIFDVSIALAYLLARDEIKFSSEKKLFLGELSLSGELQPIKGVLPIIKMAKEKGFEDVFLPHQNAREAALISGITIYGARHLSDILRHINTKKLDIEQQEVFGLSPHEMEPQENTPLPAINTAGQLEFSDIEEQDTAKRGLQIAAAGFHNVAFYGPPGTGKTLLARALASILPPLSFDDVLEVTGIHSLSGSTHGTLVTEPPFRAPHHTSSHTSVVGGGTFPRPGEITLAHKGVLFLDEFPEFDRRVIESLRGPLEEGRVVVARAKGTETFPAQFILVVAMNPCPCGYAGDPKKECSCTQSSILRYKRKVSGPIVDRIDMWIEVPRIAHEKLSQTTKKEVTAEEKERVGKIKSDIVRSRALQKERCEHFGKTPTLNGTLDVRGMKEMLVLGEKTKKTLDSAAKSLDLSGRAYHRVIKLARTIADLEASEAISEKHILEALQYRPKSVLS